MMGAASHAAPVERIAVTVIHTTVRASLLILEALHAPSAAASIPVETPYRVIARLERWDR